MPLPDSLVRLKQMSNPEVSGYVVSIIKQYLTTGSVTGVAANTGQLTGAFYPLKSNPSGYVVSSQITGLVSYSYLAGNNTAQQAWVDAYYYPRNNPSGYITTGQTGTFGQSFLNSSVVFTTGSQVITGNKIFHRIRVSAITGLNVFDDNSVARLVIGPTSFVVKDADNFDFLVNRNLADDQGNYSIDWNNRELLTSDNVATVSWGSNNLVSLNGDTSVDWESRRLTDSGSSPTLFWNTRQLSGDWSAQTFNVSGKRVLTLADTGSFSNPDLTYVVKTTGNQNVSGIKNFVNGIAIPNNLDSTNRYLKNSGNGVTIDWQNQLLKTQAFISYYPSVDWKQRVLYDANILTGLDWNLKRLYDSSQNLTVDWNNRILTGGLWYAQDIYIGGHPALTSGNFTGYVDNNYYPRNNPSGYITGVAADATFVRTTGNQNISGGKTFQTIKALTITGSGIYDNGGNLRVNLTNNAFNMYDWNGSNFILNRVTYSVGNIASIDWQNRYLFDISGYSSLFYSNRVALDGSENTSIDWGQRKLKDSSSTTILNWQTCKLSDNNTSLDWRNRSLFNGDDTQVLNWETGVLLDTNAQTSIDWTNRQLSGNWSAEILNVSGQRVLTLADTGSFATKTYVDTSFYPSSNPNGYISAAQAGGVQSLQVSTGNLSGVVLVTGVGGVSVSTGAGNSIIISNSLDVSELVRTTGVQTISGIKTFVNTIQFPSGMQSNGNTSFNIAGGRLSVTNGLGGPYFWFDGTSGYLSSTDGISVDWWNRNLSGNWKLNNTGLSSLFTSYVHLTGNETISGVKTFTSGIFIANTLDTPNRVLRKSNGYDVVDWENYTLNGPSIIANHYPTIDWSGRNLFDLLVVTGLNWRYRRLYDSNADISADWNARYLTGTWRAPILSGTTNRPVSLNLSSGILSGNWTGQNFTVPSKFSTISNTLSGSWFASNLTATNLSVNNFIGREGYSELLDMTTLVMKDDSSLNTSLAWGDRNLQTSTGSISLDWENRILNDNWTVQDLTVNNSLLTNYVGIWDPFNTTHINITANEGVICAQYLSLIHI
jgi:hypothetical protein